MTEGIVYIVVEQDYTYSNIYGIFDDRALAMSFMAENGNDLWYMGTHTLNARNDFDQDCVYWRKDDKETEGKGP